jgi:hypothetical protein
MRYILMINASPGTKDWDLYSWPPEDVKAHVAYWNRLNKKLVDAGELAALETLAPPREARLVRAGKDGLPATDGVFPETKEFLAGYWIVDVERPERAYAIAAEASLVPGPGGKPMMLPIEVRPVMSSRMPQA